MARFTIYSPAGVAIYEGAPSFTGQYMKPGMLEFREVAMPSLVDLVPGCYVDYTRTGHRYRIYTVPQLKKQARSLSYGGAFVYQSVQLYDASKMLEYCPFRDLVLGDNRIHFSTQPSISTFEGCDGLARRFEACLVDQYGEGSWRVRIATAEENPSLHDLMLEPRDFTVSGVNILECLDKIYEIWPEVGWIYKVEVVDGVPTDTIIIGGGGIGSNTGTYAYGKGNGLTSLTRTAANAEEIANRIFAYGSSRNMVLPSWYRNQDIKDAESVDIQNLMLPILPIVSKDWSGWGLTDGERDAAKAFVENATSILKNGLRPATVYFDGKGEYPEIYPSIRETTIGMVRNALGDSTAKYYPSTAIYTDPGARVDKLLSAQATFDSGLAGNAPGKANVEMGDTPFSASGSFGVLAGLTYYPFYHYQGTWTPETAGVQTIAWKLDLSGQVQLDGIEKVVVSVKVKDPSYQGPVILSDEYELTPDASGIVVFSGKEMVADKVSVSSVAYFVNVDIAVYMTAQSTDKTGTYTANGNVGFALQNYRKKTLTISLRQMGFDLNEQADLGNGKTIAMRSGDCVGRSFAIKSVQYNSANDCWDLECWRSEDESLSQWFPNSQFGVAAGDEFVLLDIAMPDIYIAMASEKLLDAARELLDDSAVERWQYNPEIDAKFMVENSRTINAGEYLILSDADIIGPSSESILVDTITINEGEAAIPTYKVTLRDRKKKTWTESQSPEQSSSKSVGSITNSNSQQSSNGGDSYFQLDGEGNVTLKPQYQNLWVQGWLAAGGVGQGGSGGGGGGLITSVKGVADLGTAIPTESLTETFSAKAIETIWEAVLDLQQGSNVSLVNGASYSTITVNGTTADFYTKSQIDAIVGAVYRPAGNASSVSELGTLTATNIGKVYNMTAAFTTTADFLEGAGKSFPAGTNVVIVDAGSGTYKYDVLSGFVDLSGYAQKVVGATAGNFAGLDANGNLTDSGHKHGDYVTALGTSGNNLTWTKNGTANNITVPFATKAEKDGSGNTISDYYVTKTTAQTITGAKTFSQAITLSGSTNTARRIYFGDANHYLELDQYGFHFSHGVYSDDFVAAGGIGNTGGGGGGGLISSVYTWSDLQSMSSAPTDDTSSAFNARSVYEIYQVLQGSTPNVSLVNGSSYSTLTVNGTTASFYTKDQVDTIVGNIDLSDYALKTGDEDYDFLVNSLELYPGNNTDSFVLSAGKYALKPAVKCVMVYQDNTTIPATEITETKYLAFKDDIPTSLKNPYALTFGSKTYDGSSAKTILASDLGALTTHQTVTLASGTNDGTLKLTTAAGAVDNIAVKGLQALAYKASLLASDIPDISGTYVTLAGAQTITGAKIFSANLTLSENLVMGAAKHIDLGPARIEYDAVTGAIHVTTNQTGSGAPTIGFYADGFVASGGVGSSGGGGGYGVESITSNQDGTVDFHFTGGDVTTVDLNHEHPQYNSKLAESSQPSGGFLPDVVYELGTITGSVTFSLASAVSGQVNHYFWTFTAGSTAPTITWPSGITWVDSAPTITASKKYQISIIDGVAAYMEA